MAAAEGGVAAKHVSFERERGVYELQVTADLAHIVVTVGADSGRADRLSHVFNALATQSIPIFLVKLHSTAVSFAVAGARVPEVEGCLRAMSFDCTTRHNLALIAVIATSMRDLTGIMVSIADALHAAGTTLYGVGDSHNSVQCLIDGERIEPALAHLRSAFDLEGTRG